MITVMGMNDLTPRSSIRTVIEENGDYGWTVAAIAGEVLYRSPTHLDEKSARGWLIDLRAALADARCTWCGDPATLVSEIDGLDVYAFDSDECHTESLKEAHEEEMWK
jgi:hypothetical protein